MIEFTEKEIEEIYDCIDFYKNVSINGKRIDCFDFLYNVIADRRILFSMTNCRTAQ